MIPGAPEKEKEVKRREGVIQKGVRIKRSSLYPCVLQSLPHSTVQVSKRRINKERRKRSHLLRELMLALLILEVCPGLMIEMPSEERRRLVE